MTTTTATTTPSSAAAIPFDRERHIRYFCYSLRQLPDPYSKLDTNRLTLVHFCVHALDLLGALEEQVNVNQVVEWIYRLQMSGGFCGGSFLSANDGIQAFAHCHDVHGTRHTRGTGRRSRESRQARHYTYVTAIATFQWQFSECPRHGFRT